MEGKKNHKKIIQNNRSCPKLKELEAKFKVIFVGDGKDSNDYKKRVQELNLEKEIIFLGRKKNPFPYVKKSDCVLLTSEYEGSPVVFTETMILNKPIITTDVAGSEQNRRQVRLCCRKKCRCNCKSNAIIYGKEIQN